MISNNRVIFFLVIISLLNIFACTENNFQAPILEGLGNHALDITTDSKYSRLFFNQGLNLAYGFNHAEAERAYRESIRQDATNAMAYWGVAHVLGTNYNAVMDDVYKEKAYQYTQKALQHINGSSDWEQALITASLVRFKDYNTIDQTELDKRYADAMRKVYGQYPLNDDIVVLFAESLMNLHPWDLYTKKGVAKPWTSQITSILEVVLERNALHPGANHLYIHAVEQSDTPERGLASAKRLEDLIPGAGHLVHMPSHIYIRTGKYHQGSVVNEQASIVDSIYIAKCNAQGVYPLTYYPHNLHFLAATAAYEGRGETSINAAFRVAAHTDTTLMRENGLQTLQHYSIIPYYVLVKFSQWDHILKLDKPASDLLYPLAVWHYARGMAFVGKNQLKKAREELTEVSKLAKNPALANITIWDINSANYLVDIAQNVLKAEILREEGDLITSIILLKHAVDIEDQLNYNEPPDWFFSVRHTLGAVLLQNKDFVKAEAVYKEDLFYFPENGWSLNGLYSSLIGQNKIEEALDVFERLEEAWRYADIKLNNSEVQEVAYNNIQERPIIDNSLLALMQKVTSCGPRIN